MSLGRIINWAFKEFGIATYIQNPVDFLAGPTVRAFENFAQTTNTDPGVYAQVFAGFLAFLAIYAAAKVFQAILGFPHDKLKGEYSPRDNFLIGMGTVLAGSVGWSVINGGSVWFIARFRDLASESQTFLDLLASLTNPSYPAPKMALADAVWDLPVLEPVHELSVELGLLVMAVYAIVMVLLTESGRLFYSPSMNPLSVFIGTVLASAGMVALFDPFPIDSRYVFAVGTLIIFGLIFGLMWLMSRLAYNAGRAGADFWIKEPPEKMPRNLSIAVVSAIVGVLYAITPAVQATVGTAALIIKLGGGRDLWYRLTGAKKDTVEVCETDGEKQKCHPAEAWVRGGKVKAIRQRKPVSDNEHED